MNKKTEAIKETRQSTDETEKIIKVIDEIAFQTNLLALNTAAEAAKDTDALIEGSQDNADNGVKTVEGFIANHGEVTSSIEKAANLFQEVSNASDEQAQGFD